MKALSFIATVLSLLALSAHSAAQITLGPFPPMVVVGENYTLKWTATANFTYTLWLIEEENGNPYSWEPVENLTSGAHFTHLDGSYTWTVPSNLSASGVYAVWIFGAVIPPDGQESNGQEVNTQTEWFTITSPSPSSSSSSSTTTSATATPTTTATHSATSSSAPTNGASKGSSDSKLSGGAIAGLVIGIILALAIAFGVVGFLNWRKKRSARQGREAEARANRLAPVMQEGTSSYEMSGRMP